MSLSNDGFVAFHYRSYGTFFLQQNRLHNYYSDFTHYRNYRAIFYHDCLSRFLKAKIPANPVTTSPKSLSEDVFSPVAGRLSAPVCL